MNEGRTPPPFDPSPLMTPLLKSGDITLVMKDVKRVIDRVTSCIRNIFDRIYQYCHIECCHE